MKQESIRSYRVESGTDAAFAVTGVMVLLLPAGLFTNPEEGSVRLFLLPAAFLLVPALLQLTSDTTTIEIDAASGLVRKTTGFFIWNKRETYSLREIDAVRFVEKNIFIEEGYGITSYSVVLERKKAVQELLATNDEIQARSLCCQLLELIGPAEQAK
jgi:hypothetical protein